MAADRRRPGATPGRGQTTLDYAVGVGIFIVAVAFAFTFTLHLLAPAAGAGGETDLDADRTANHLAIDDLTEDRYVWNRTRVDTFFARSEDAAIDRVPLQEHRHLNVTLEAGDQRWTIGPTPPDSDTVGTAWRVGTLDGTRTDLRVRVW